MSTDPNQTEPDDDAPPPERHQDKSKNTQMMERRVGLQALVIVVLLGVLYMCTGTAPE